MKGRAYSNSPRVYRPYTLLDALPFQFTKPPNFSLSTSGQLLGALCIMYHAPCVIDSHVTIATDRAYAFGLSFERFSTSRPNHQFRQSSLRPCCQRFIETSAPSAFFRTYAHLRSSKGLPLHVVTGRPGRASGGFMLQRGPCARKDPKPPETRWIEVVQGRQSREPAIRSLSQPEHKRKPERRP